MKPNSKLLLNCSRRQVLQWLAFGSLGFAGAASLKGCSQKTLATQTFTTQTFTTVKVNPQGEIVEELSKQVKVLTENLSNEVSLEMLSIPGGSFMMGSPENEEGRYDRESPQHQVNLPPFFLSKYPVTQAQYEAIMGINIAYFRGANRPIEQVSWYDVRKFCQKLSQQTGKNYRLPSEAEWEYACRAGTTTPFYFGETITTELANYNGDYAYSAGPKGVFRESTTKVDTFAPNAFGLYDMHGNVYEWCQDIWHENYNDAPTDGSAWETGGDGSLRLLRGGTWNNEPWISRSAFRTGAESYNSWWHAGFRVALTLEA